MARIVITSELAMPKALLLCRRPVLVAVDGILLLTAIQFCVT
ncbi:hypothetical protein CCHR01_12827 [Colletotrichum chrysophilum]|uniref:Uncharacterized protein n=1 Tax=Colletotrichum chrysophilum TaxID=1836956 RepID=A0AAD9EEA6_9PEZI|nr:hypothetical protein CCHR01_12827 [Colletotrichum chrysophilum]